VTASTIFLDFSEDVAELLTDNTLDLVEELRSLGLDVRRGDDPDPAGVPGAKGLELTILAIGVSIPLVAAGIARICDALGRNRTAVKELHLLPVLDREGAPVRAPDGRPLVYWAEVHSNKSTERPSRENLSVEAGLTKLSVTLDSQHG
jgi:hypothetical protein